MNWPISWNDVKNHIDDMEDGIPPELLPQGGFGYSEPSKVLTWDGDKNNEIELPDGVFIKRFADFVDMTKVESVTAEGSGTGIITFSKSQLTVNAIGDGDLIRYALLASDIPMLLSFNVGPEGVEAGTYVVSTGTGFRFISATMSETIHPIDPKYLPTSLGNVLQVRVVADKGNQYTANVSFEEAVEAITNGAYLDVKLIYVYEDGVSTCDSMTRYEYHPNSYDVPAIEIHWVDFMTYWTADGISTNEPPGGK